VSRPLQNAEAPPAALTGVRVIEIGTFLSAPFAASLLGDFGADVIKIELPGEGDPMRALGSAFPPHSDSSYWWSSIGRNKRSLTLDVRTPEGRDILGRLVETSNVFIENFRPGTLDKWGITRDWLRERRSDLHIARISGYGQDGPWRNVPGFDRNAQAFSGLVYLTGEADGPPQQAGLPVCDYTAGLWAAFGVVTAMLGRQRHGGVSGNEIDVALYETMIPFLKDVPQTYRHADKIIERTGNTPGYVSPGGAHRTGDGEWIFISGTGDRVFIRLMGVIGRQDLAEAPQFKLNRDRVAGRAVLDEAIDAWLSERSTAEAIAALDAADVPAAKIHSIADLMNHPQVVARGNFVDVPDHDRGDVCISSPLPRLARMGGSIRWAGQDLGEANTEILSGELGLTSGEIEELRRRGVVG
jgi:crotonobetainyl-CoA:carnitine CoA-transferase CaiB-like acyl-CoA transferase